MEGKLNSILVKVDKLLKEDISESTKEFLLSLKSFYKFNGSLTDRQLKSLEKIESRFSPEQKKMWDEWVTLYRDNFKSDAKIVARYYQRAGYYTKLANSIVNEEDYVPTRHDLDRIINNKYAQKVLQQTKAEPRFNVDQQVQIRSLKSKGWAVRDIQQYSERICFVLRNDLEVINACKGGKRYLVLPMSAPEPIEIDERYLMKPNRRGKYSESNN
jgi:hypothetical protein